MVGGHDFIYPHIGGAAARSVALTHLRHAWPEAVVVDPSSETEQALIPIAHAAELLALELLVFENAEAEKSWSERGLSAENANSLIILFIHDDETTVVVARAAVRAPVVKELRAALDQAQRLQVAGAEDRVAT